MSLFRVESLDTRLCASQDPEKRQKIASRACPVRWFSREFAIYWLCFAVCVPLMVKAPYDVSRPSNPNYGNFSHLLSDGWLGRPVDNSDSQYSNFRDIFPLLVGLVLGHQALRRVVRMDKLKFDALFGIVLISVLHGVGAVKILLILAINYKLPRGTLLNWAFAMGVLIANELTEGYTLKHISPYLGHLESLAPMARWQVFFKCTMMRMLSFNLDRAAGAAAETLSHESTGEKLDMENEPKRISTPLPVAGYTFTAYLAYCLYTPLYIAGPILTFNDYVRQRNSPLKSIEPRRIAVYAVRFVVCIMAMELLIHYCYVVAISSTRSWQGNTPAQISMIALFNLAHIWLKLLIPWRFFRLWALLDGIDGPENMVRCVANNYSALLFWRSWHRSFNRWVLRYLYIPLGGSKRPILNSIIVFTFVALWHDINPRLLIWGWLVVLFVLPEMIAARLLPQRTYGQFWWYRHVCAIGAVLNIWMMMIANLVGFAVGVDGIKDILWEMTHTANGLAYSVFASCMLFVGAQAMFEVREREHRAGIDLKC